MKKTAAVTIMFLAALYLGLGSTPVYAISILLEDMGDHTSDGTLLWLDWSETTGWSYNNVLSSDYIAQGYTLATYEQLEGFLTLLELPSSSFNEPDLIPVWDEVFDLVGLTYSYQSQSTEDWQRGSFVRGAPGISTWSDPTSAHAALTLYSEKSSGNWHAEASLDWDVFHLQNPDSEVSNRGWALVLSAPTSEPIPEPTFPEPIPEPTSMILLGTGLGVVGFVAYRRKRK